jgi:hypothetical protein
MGNYAFITAHSTGLHVIDISDPSNPRVLGSASFDGDTAGHYVYLVLANVTLGGRLELDEVAIREGYIEIREADAGKVIAVLEFLSPSNKRRGAGQELYLAKQTEVLGSEASLVEIDLVRAGQRVLALPSDDIPFEHRQDYLACVSPGWRRRRRELYPMPLRQRLPLLPILVSQLQFLARSSDPSLAVSFQVGQVFPNQDENRGRNSCQI